MRRLAAVCASVIFAAVSVLPAGDKEAANRLKPTNLAFNTSADEDEPHVASDGKRLIYLATTAGKSALMASNRTSTKQTWPVGKEADDLSVIADKDRILGGLFLPPAGRPPHFVYYASKTIGEKNASFDMFVAIKVLPGPDKVFTEARALLNVDSPDDEMHPWLTGDGRSLYFSRRTKEGWRVLVAQRKPKEMMEFDEPITLDLPPDYFHATLTPDGKTMYLQGALGKDRWGLFVSTKSAKGWSLPQALSTLNHPDGPTGERSPNLSRDGNLLYFASDRPGGKGGLDIWVIPTAQLTKKR